MKKTVAWVLAALLLAVGVQADDRTYYPVQELLVTGTTVVGEDIRYPATGVPRWSSTSSKASSPSITAPRA